MNDDRLAIVLARIIEGILGVAIGWIIFNMIMKGFH